jgi:hypothetical protein
LDPAIRASAVHDSLAYLDKFEPGARERVLAAVPAASRAIIDSTPSTGWIPIEHDHWTVDAMVDIFGRERAIECWRQVLIELVDRPLLGGFVANMLRVFGVSPISVVRLLVKGWPLVYRDVCDPKLIASADGQPTIRFESIAPAIRRHSNYLHCWHGVCAGYAAIARVRGDVTFEVANDLTWAEARFFWEDERDEASEPAPRKPGESAGTPSTRR